MSSEFWLSNEVLAALFLVGALLGFFFWHRFVQFFRWLKGSRRSYYRQNSASGIQVYSTPDKFRVLVGLCVGSAGNIAEGSVFEINRGFWRRRSAVRGLASKNWQLVKVSEGNNLQGGFSDDRIYLKDQLGLPLQESLRLINTCPSLQAMLDEVENQKKRIDELETELARMKVQYDLVSDHACAWSSGIFAVLEVMEDDRQYYRSKAAEHVRKCLDKIKRDWYPMGKAGRSLSWKDKVASWRKCFPPLKD